MVKTIYCCDRCKRVIIGDIFDIAFGIYKNDEKNVTEWDGNELHLCEKCVNEIYNSIEEHKKEVETLIKNSNLETFKGVFVPEDGEVAGIPFSMTFSGNKTSSIPENDIFNEVDLPEYVEDEIVELPFGVEKNQKKTYNLNELIDNANKLNQLSKKFDDEVQKVKENTKDTQSEANLKIALADLNKALDTFASKSKVIKSNTPPTTHSQKPTKGIVGQVLADKLIQGINSVSMSDMIIPGALENKLMKIEKSFTPEEIDYLREIDQEGELTNFFAQVFEDALKRK